MDKYIWRKTKELKAFKAEDGTLFIRGPWKFDDETYDWKLIDKQGEDYCTEEQMLAWDVRFKSIYINETLHVSES